MEKRIISLFAFFCFCFSLLMTRVAYINFSGFSEAGNTGGTRTVTIGRTRGKIYDRNLRLLVDSEEKLIAAVTPATGSEQYLYLMKDEGYAKEKIQTGQPFVSEVKDKVSNEFLRSFSVPVRYSENQSAVHLIGYLSSDGENGLSGIERAYNAYLSENSGELIVSFEVDAKGRVLAGMDKYINDDNFNSQAGLVLTIDKDIQLITENALRNSTVKSGCAVVMQVNSGEIVALASVPTYDPDNVAEALYEENSPLINKVLQQYSVGSVFKPLVAATALENGIDPMAEYECNGSCKVGDKTFSCYNSTAHGAVNMQSALEKSCNCYFIDLIMQTDVEYLLKLCNDIGIGKADTVADGINTSAGVLPDAELLKTKGELSNFAFGQGCLMMTPVQMLKMYHTLATGNLISPSVIYGTMDSSGNIVRNTSAVPQKLLTDGTVKKMRQMLLSVTENGNAFNAKSDIVSLAGKTGTAQSGIYKEGLEICRTWFAGFFPAEAPEYIVVVMNENGMGGNSDCGPVFKEICEAIVN
ncbi:MAG: penicillin-binding protein 2 [Clostridia bacterium]|nr:penicillin-binding protein 2 [Clostridia bacterium]